MAPGFGHEMEVIHYRGIAANIARAAVTVPDKTEEENDEINTAD
jgi:hypothetical protein